MSVFSERLRELRGGQSQTKMAEPLGWTYQQWAKYERGESSPSVKILVDICNTHRASADWLLGLDIKSIPHTAIATAPNAVAIAGYNQSVVVGESSSCAKCPYKKKVKAFEKIMGK